MDSYGISIKRACGLYSLHRSAFYYPAHPVADRDEYLRMRIRNLAIEVLENILQSSRGVPSMITLDNGPEFTSIAFDKWAHERNIQLDFITPGRPCENGFAESFHGRTLRPMR